MTENIYFNDTITISCPLYQVAYTLITAIYSCEYFVRLSDELYELWISQFWYKKPLSKLSPSNWLQVSSQTSKPITIALTRGSVATATEVHQCSTRGTESYSLTSEVKRNCHSVILCYGNKSWSQPSLKFVLSMKTQLTNGILNISISASMHGHSSLCCSCPALV